MSKHSREVRSGDVNFLPFVKAPKCLPPGPLGSVVLGQNMDVSGRLDSPRVKLYEQTVTRGAWRSIFLSFCEQNCQPTRYFLLLCFAPLPVLRRFSPSVDARLRVAREPPRTPSHAASCLGAKRSALDLARSRTSEGHVRLPRLARGSSSLRTFGSNSAKVRT